MTSKIESTKDGYVLILSRGKPSDRAVLKAITSSLREAGLGFGSLSIHNRLTDVKIPIRFVAPSK